MSSIFGDKPVVGIIMGSESDMPTMEACMKQLEELDVPYEVKVASAHRKPAEVYEWASSAVDRGIRVIIAAAGKAAHLGGCCRLYTAPCYRRPHEDQRFGRFGLAAFHGSDAQRRTCRNGCYQWRKECRHPGCSDARHWQR